MAVNLRAAFLRAQACLPFPKQSRAILDDYLIPEFGLIAELGSAAPH
jgi:hypothetical protein